ncbi:MAG: glycerol-3-phosphate responsive antiterminator [Clostridiales bacterium]|nr:glycerol-3-phosphate responsive antiterminator [Clostridiales bacterium]
MRKHFLSLLQDNPIIAAVKDLEKLQAAVDSPCDIIFLLNGNIFNLKNIVDKVKDRGKNIYIHIDLMEGFSRDIVALKYISKNIKPDGIITTKSSLIKITKNMNLFAIQRLFILDSLSVKTGISTLNTTKPDSAELLPGIMPKVIKRIGSNTNVPIIAGGLIETKKEVIESLNMGAFGISTTNKKVWYE